MYEKKLSIPLVIVSMTIIATANTVEDNEAELVEGLSPAVEEQMYPMRQRSNMLSNDEENISLEMVNGVITRKIKTDTTKRSLIDDSDIEEVEGLAPAMIESLE